MTRSISIAGVSLELEERGDGTPLLFLHAGEGLAPQPRRGSICWRGAIA